MRAFLLLMFILSGLVSCVREYKYCNCEVADEQLSAYNDIINELVERRLYNFYLGKDEERFFKAYVENPADTDRIRTEIIGLQNEIYGDTSRFCTLYLDTLLWHGFENLKYYETDTGEYSKQFINIISSISNNKQAIIDSLNERQIKYSPADFSLCSSRIVPVEDADKSASTCTIGRISISRLVLNEEGNKGVLYYEFRCGELCGKGELLYIEKSNGRWHIYWSMRSWVS